MSFFFILIAGSEHPSLEGTPTRRSRRKLVRLLLLSPLIGSAVVAENLGPGLCNNSHIDIGARAKVIEDTGLDGIFDQINCFLFLFIREAADSA
jgi:hypothetical protein